MLGSEEVLAAATLERGLGSILIFTAAAAVVRDTAGRLAGFLSAARGREVPVVNLGQANSDEALWGTLLPKWRRGRLTLRWSPGPLVQRGRNRPRVLLIPDLTNISLPLARASIALMDAETASLERFGQSRVWTPDLYWVAGCARGRIGEISPHLLDRFALRFAVPEGAGVDRVSEVFQFANRGGELPAAVRPGVSPEWEARLHEARGRYVPFGEEGRALVLSFARSNPGQGMRRELALARMACALARWEGAAQVTTGHVGQAARFLEIAAPGTPAPALSEAKERPTAAQEVAGPPGDRDRTAAAAAAATSATGAANQPEAKEPVYRPDTEVALPATTLPPGPYPEDATPPWRPIDSLKLPPRRSGGKAIQGPILGTQAAMTVRDIAFVSSILEAAKYQKIRKAKPGEFRMERGDLRAYRRAPVPQQTFVGLIDYTSVEDTQWEDALLPHLSWAYTSRATVSLILVGAASAGDPLRAGQVVARSLLSPAVTAALSDVPGSATPLAHGLHLALQSLRSALERGRSRALQARFVMLSDGRGNVPLEASHHGRIAPPVGRQGVDDALAMARELGVLRDVQSFYLNPQPQQYPDLPVSLAQALRAEVQLVAMRQPEAARV